MIAAATEARPKKLLSQARAATQAEHCSARTEGTYIVRGRHFILLPTKRHWNEVGSAKEVPFG